MRPDESDADKDQIIKCDSWKLWTAGWGVKGYTLIELLIVVVLIVVLAAIALPQFLGQSEKAQDAAAKSNARNMESQIESCYTQAQTYVGCDTSVSRANSGLNIGPGAGQVNVSVLSGSGYTITAVSNATTSGTNHTFQIIHAQGVPDSRTCAPADSGGCGNSQGSTSW